MKIQTVFVVGAGQMGAGIAQVFAQSGHAVTMYDVNLAFAEKGRARIEKNLAKQVEKGRLAQGEMEDVLSRLQLAESLDSAAHAQLAIEAATEDPEVKKELFRRLDVLLPADAILASNTSSISITALAACTNRPQKVAGMHFFNPVPVMKLVEVVRGIHTSDDVAQTLHQLALGMGKVPVACKDSPAFIVNRLLIPMINEAAFLLAEGVSSAQEIDTATVNGLNHPMGPLALADLIGLDVVLAIMQVLQHQTGDSKYRPCPLLRQMVDAGLLGRKTGRGFYAYNS